MNHRLDNDIFTNETCYFYTLQGPRFAEMNQLMAESLERKFGQKFKPIVVYSAHPNELYAADNYIVLNKMASDVESEISDHVIFLQEYEDLNVEFIESSFISDISRQLLEKQDQIFVYPFTTSFLKPKDIPYQIIGPDSEIATIYDSKASQYKLFHDLRLPCNKARIFANKGALLEGAKELLPFYITAAFSSGGNESTIVFSEDMLKDFLAGLREVNTTNEFVVIDIFKDLMVAPNVSAVVTDVDKTKVLIIADQILRGMAYLGNTFPSVVSAELEAQIVDITTTLGNHLSHQGYRGMFGCDFLINKRGELVVVDLNPRRQGGYVCNAYAVRSLGIELTDLELELSLGEKSDINHEYEKPNHPQAWAHAKIKPFDGGQSIASEVREGSVPEIFSSGEGDYGGLFYEQGSYFVAGYIGHAAVTGSNLDEVTKRINEVSADLLDRGLA